MSTFCQHKLTLFLFGICLAACSCLSHGFAITGDIAVDSEDFSHRLADGIEYFVDPSKTLTMHEVAELAKQGEFRRFNGNTLQFGYSSSVYWLRIPIVNLLQKQYAIGDEHRYYLTVKYPLLDDVQFFHQRADSTSHVGVGDNRRFQDRILQLNDFVFPFSMTKQERSVVYLRVESSSSISIPIYLETEKAFIERKDSIDAVNGVYFGITFGLCIYNLFLWVGVRRKVYGYYVLAIINLMLFNATILGYSFRFWPEWIEFQQVGIYFFSITSGTAVCFFGMAFLETAKHQPKMHKVLFSSVILFLLCLPVILFSPPELSAKLNVVIMLTGISMLFVLAIRSVLQGYGPARYYLLGQGAVLFSVVFTVLTSQGIIPLFYIAPEVMKWSSAFELIFFSIGLADLVNNERKLREDAQKETARTQQKLLDEQVRVNEHLDTLVRQRTEELEQANQRLEELNTLDELTGLRNRRFLNQALPTEYQRAFREKQPISLLMFDIDYFKKLNDTYGHQFGDLCLVNAGKFIRTNLHRPTDIAVRYGGEEFIVLLPATDLKGAMDVAENIRSVFESNEVTDGNHKVNMTVSIGVAGGIPDERESYEQLLKAADDLLYRAKEAGRNRTMRVA